MSRKENDKEPVDPVKIQNEEQLRQQIRERIMESMQRNGSKGFDERMKKQLKDDIKKDLISVPTRSLFETFETLLNPPENRPTRTPPIFTDPGPSYRNQYDEDEQTFQDQLKLAIELSKMNLQEDKELKNVTKEEERASDCGICLDQISDSISYGCEHMFCAECVTGCLNSAITDGLLDSLKCPGTNCNQHISEPLIRKLVSNEMFVRYEDLMLRAAVADMDDIFYCTNEKCGAILEAETDIGCAICHKCGHTFCTNCSKPFHGTSDCELNDNERKEMLQTYNDELIAENLMREESLNQLAIEAAERENEEWLTTIREEQDAIRVQENIEAENRERDLRQAQRLEEERKMAEEQQRERERIEHERNVEQHREQERQERIRRENRRKQDQESENTVKAMSKPCPSCKSPIQKNGGCVHMTCKCSYEFCWECMGRWSHDHTC